MTAELEKFAKALDDRDIEWQDASDGLNEQYRIDRIHFRHNKKRVSVIHGYATYGGYNSLTEKDAGLLEVMIGDKEPVGWLTCEEALKLIFENDK